MRWMARTRSPHRPAAARWLVAASCVLWLAVTVLFAHLSSHPELWRRRLRLLIPAQSFSEPMPRWHVDRG